MSEVAVTQNGGVPELKEVVLEVGLFVKRKETCQSPLVFDLTLEISREGISVTHQTV